MASLAVAEQTLTSLEERLQRLGFLLHGDLDSEDAPEVIEPQVPAAARLRRLERSMQSLKEQSNAVSQLLNLQAQYPTLFAETAPREQMHDMDDQSLASLIVSHAPSYQSTASRLTSLKDLPIPDASLSASLVSMIPRMKKLKTTEEIQEVEVAELQDRTAAVIERWYGVGVLAMGECWSEWEGRLSASEMTIRREQAKRARESDAG